jgi:hypothetical protein
LDKEISGFDSYKQAEKNEPFFEITRNLRNTEVNLIEDAFSGATAADAAKSSPATSTLTSFAQHDVPVLAEAIVGLPSCIYFQLLSFCWVNVLVILFRSVLIKPTNYTPPPSKPSAHL